jgi:N-acetylneuraminic acid mutarotase
LFDPISGKWIFSGRLLAPGSGHSASVFADRRVLITGGRDTDGNVLDERQTFGPRIARWSHAPRLNFPREGHAALTLDDGHILVVGGISGVSNMRLEQRTTSPRSRIQKLR